MFADLYLQLTNNLLHCKILSGMATKRKYVEVTLKIIQSSQELEKRKSTKDSASAVKFNLPGSSRDGSKMKKNLWHI